jgi:hypothetical protein
MNTVLDNSLVGLALLISAGYAVVSLGPKILRKRLLAALSRLMAGAPRFLRLGGAAQRLSAASDAKAKGACGGCDNCATEQSSAPHVSSAEINVPVARISRRR